ncbi:UNVERIFIED_CONTAM: hypothetical protein K2H54_054941 [Gekko kuhli]
MGYHFQKIGRAATSPTTPELVEEPESSPPHHEVEEEPESCQDCQALERCFTEFQEMVDNRSTRHATVIIPPLDRGLGDGLGYVAQYLQS